MPYVNRGNARLFYDDLGEGEPILTTHGVCENGSYWSLPGVSEKLAARYRVIDTDMRGHGRTIVSGDDKGYDVDTMAEDIAAIADGLGLDRFHLLTHATGGMVGLRYAMHHSDRLLSLMSTDTGSATLPSDEVCAPEFDDKDDYQKIPGVAAPMGAMWETQEATALMAGARSSGQTDPFLNRLDSCADPDAAWAIVTEVLATGNHRNYAAFHASFYDDPDPKVKLLRGIECPCLVLLGDADIMFIKPSELLARTIPNVKHVVLEGMGHMTAIEDPQRTSDELLGFLDALPR
jgi:pimeloyl-ACP methyl ester carboxylesterase